MRRLISAVFIFAFAIIATPIANASNVDVTITEPTHRQSNGVFIDDGLVSLLTFDGRLGKLVFDPPRGNRTWFIDAQLIEEVKAMTEKYILLGDKEGTGSEVAKSWLSQLDAITRGDRISALPYGDPSDYWISKLVPSQKNFYLELGAKRLTAALGRQVSQLTNFPISRRFAVESSTLQAFYKAQSILKLNSEYMKPDEIERFQALCGSVFHPDLPSRHRTILGFDLTSSTQRLSNRIRLAPGRFTVTSTKQKLPITLINDFPNPAKVSINVEASNGKVFVSSLPQIAVNGNSKLQVMIPVEVIASGKSSLVVTIYSDKNKVLGSEVSYPVTLKVISPIATWITTGAGVILFISALIKSSRRIRRKRT